MILTLVTSIYLAYFLNNHYENMSSLYDNEIKSVLDNNYVFNPELYENYMKKMNIENVYIFFYIFSLLLCILMDSIIIKCIFG